MAHKSVISYAGKIDAQLIEAVFSNIPAQLSSVMDKSVKRFKFKNVYGRKSRYSDFENAIHWLLRYRLALTNYPNDEGVIVPIEVKSGKRTRAKSLASYIEKCTPHKTFKLTGTQGGTELEQTNHVMPLYYTRYLTAKW